MATASPPSSAEPPINKAARRIRLGFFMSDSGSEDCIWLLESIDLNSSWANFFTNKDEKFWKWEQLYTNICVK